MFINMRIKKMKMQNTQFVWMIALLALVGSRVAGAQGQSEIDANSGTSRADFREQVDISPLNAVAVYHNGRLKSFESFARSMMQFVSGPHAGDLFDQSAGFTYLDLMFRNELYNDADIIYVKSEQVRAQIVDALRNSVREQFDIAHQGAGNLEQVVARLDQRLERFMEDGLLSPQMLSDPQVNNVLNLLSRDLIRTAKAVNAIDTAMQVSQPGTLRNSLRFLPPPSERSEDPWVTLDRLGQIAMRDNSRTDMDMDGSRNLPHADMNPDLRDQLLAAWSSLNRAWSNADASGVNDAVERLANLLPQVNGQLYPDRTQLSWETWYFKMKNLTWVWIIYALALVPLLLSLVFRWNGARWMGLGLFLIAFALHTFAIGLRWYVAGRWPNSNMFEAVTTAAWFGGCAAIILEIMVRRTAMRNIFALGAGASSMIALMCAYYMPLDLSPTIENKMPVLHNVWLYIHTNVIIFSYCLIFMAAVSAFLYLLYRLAGSFMHFGDGWREYARVGGAGSLMMGAGGGGAASNPALAARARTTLGQVLDGTTMILMELSFVLLWAGIVMGAIWADHSWGRPWGWDPKEVFALNTFIIFAILIHTRIKTRDKGLWTAILAVIGAGVMLFNWIAINFVITGLHSYA